MEKPCDTASTTSWTAARHHILTAFVVDTYLVLAHLECDDKSNEIPAVQIMLGALGLSDAVVTVDGVHCQKKPYVDIG